MSETVHSPWIIASDVDGTLLDASSRFVMPPRRLAGLLREQLPGAQLVLASSRTVAELRVIQRALGIWGPVIAEDGAIVARLVRERETTDDLPIAEAAHTQRFGDSLSSLRQRWRPLVARLQLPYRTADELTFDELRALGIRSVGAQRRAIAQRRASLLVCISQGSAAEWAMLERAATSEGLCLSRGGRWATVTALGTSKGSALRVLRADWPNSNIRVAAIGNDANDASLLQEADGRFVIRNPVGGAHPTLSAIPEARICRTVGPLGWVEMLDSLADPGSTALA